MEKWIVGEPGGPSGPFYSVVSESGRVIALQIPDEKIAYLFASFPELLNLLKETIRDYSKAKYQFEERAYRLERLIAEVDNGS